MTYAGHIKRSQVRLELERLDSRVAPHMIKPGATTLSPVEEFYLHEAFIQA